MYIQDSGFHVPNGEPVEAMHESVNRARGVIPYVHASTGFEFLSCCLRMDANQWYLFTSLMHATF